jgi:hypothetical protein
MSIRGISLVAATLLLGGIASARGDCRPYGPTTTYYPDPCCRVGPVRRFLRRVFRPSCPPPCARCAPAPVVVPCLPAAPPVVWVPPGPPVRLSPPILPQGTLPPPPIGQPSSLKSDPLPPPPPVRFDRIASRRCDDGAGHLVTLVQVGKSDSRKQAETDETGRFSVELTPGTWVVYVKDAAGKSVERGRLIIREQKVVRVRIEDAG